MNTSPSSRRVASMLAKEFRQAARDPASMIITLILPVLLMLLMGFGINLDISRVPVGIVMQDGSAASHSLATAYQNSRYFDVAEVGPVEQLKTSMSAGQLRGIIIIPVDFGRRSTQGDAAIQVLTDGSFPNPAKFMEIYARGVYATWLSQQGADRAAEAAPPVALNARFWFNTGMSSRNVLVPGSIAVVITIVGSLLTALVIAREWESGTMEALLSTPLRIREFLISKIIPYYLLGLVATAICMGVAVGIFAVPLRGSILALMLVASVYLVAALGQGLLISAVFRNQFVASQVALLVAFLPSLLLSSFVYEINAMPGIIQWLTTLVPARYLVPQLLTIFLVGNEWSTLMPDLAVLAGFGVITLLLCRTVIRRRVA